MFFKRNNVVKHLIIILISFLLLMPCVWLLNKSYYTSISKVNYWEEKEIIGLLTFILNNTNKETIRTDLNKSLDSIRFLAIRIQRGTETYIDKKIDGSDIDPASMTTYPINGYNVSVARRVYPTYMSDYKKYLSCFSFSAISIYKDNNKRWNDGRSLLYHRNLIFVIAHFFIILMLEILLLTASVKYRMSQILTSLDRNYN